MKKQKSSSFWMAVSGMCGFSLLIVVNVTNILAGWNVTAGILQICANTFVFLTWRRGYLQLAGFKKICAGIGTVIPLAMAAITFCRVLLPALIRAIH